jgi:hypothetical protein
MVYTGARHGIGVKAAACPSNGLKAPLNVRFFISLL